MADVRPIDANVLLRFVDEQMAVAKRIERNTIGVEADGTALMDLIRFEVTNAPTLGYAPVVHAHWKTKQCRDYQGYDVECEHRCTNCNGRIASDIEDIKWLYCQYCGARMDEQEKDQ